MAANHTQERIASLDILRGVAVMGILAMNILAFALPERTYMSPPSFGIDGPADMLSWALGFIFVDGKMRGLFSLLFGASTLLVIERAERSGQSAAAVHYARMGWLLLFGLAHFYLIWWGDILSAYAMVGMLIYFFRNWGVRALLIGGAIAILLQFGLFLSFAATTLHARDMAALPNPDPAMVKEWQGFLSVFGPMSQADIAKDLALHRGSWFEMFHHRFVTRGMEPFTSLMFFGIDTLGLMLLGMAGLKSGFLTGAWQNSSYRKVAIACLAVGIPAYALYAWLQWRSGFDAVTVAWMAVTFPVLMQPVMVFAYAALIILVTRAGGPLVARIAAAGRAAFTNYLGTSILMTFLFYGHGLGLYGNFSRIELWPFVIGAWIIMLAWSKPWLDRYRYGPAEWLWRSLARAKPQPMRLDQMRPKD